MKLEPYEVKVPEGRESEGYVYLSHNTQYTLLLTNQACARCDAEVWIDGRVVGAWRVPPLKTVVVERPIHETGRFTFYEVGTREAVKAGISESDQLGLLTVVFKPEALILYAPPSPSSGHADGTGLSNSPHLWLGQPPAASSGYAGGTGLSGQSDQKFGDAAPIEYDRSQTVTIHLRLVGDPNEPRPMFQRETAVPPPVRPRGSDRMMNQTLESDALSVVKGGGDFTHLPAAEDRGKPRQQALAPKHSLPPMPHRALPQAPRTRSGTNERPMQETKHRIQHEIRDEVNAERRAKNRPQSDRLKRWQYLVILLIFILGMSFVSASLGYNQTPGPFLTILGMVQIPLLWMRLTDAGLKGWIALLALIPLVGMIVGIMGLILPTKHD